MPSKQINPIPKNREAGVPPYFYDVCLSFAGEEREYVKAVAESLRGRGVKVFYDEYEVVNLWGVDLYEHLDEIYGRAARFCVIFISESYADKLWTNHERRSAEARSFQENERYILPARFDETVIPGIRPTIGYIDLRVKTPNELAQLITKKLGPHRALEAHSRERFFPSDPDILYKSVKAKSKKAKAVVSCVAHKFFWTLSKMEVQERRLVFNLFLNTCPLELRDNVHMDIDLLRRVTGISKKKIAKLLNGIDSLGFSVELTEDTAASDATKISRNVTLRWGFWNKELDEIAETPDSNFTHIAYAMIDLVSEHYCDEHAMEILMRRNFSSLSTATAVDDLH
jgi:hypothetical protein